ARRVNLSQRPVAAASFCLSETRLIFPRIRSIIRAVPPQPEGRIAIVTDVGRGMRWMCRSAGRAMPMHTVKPCGPGTPTLVPRRRDDDLADDGGKRARSPGRARYKP